MTKETRATPDRFGVCILRRIAQWRLRGAYVWEHASGRRLAYLRAWLDRAMPNGCRSVVSGAEPGALTLSYVGITNGVAKILELLEHHREALGHSTRWRSDVPVSGADLLRVREEQSADLIAVGCTARQANRLPTRSAIVLPFRVHAVVDVSGEAAEVQQHISKREREKFRTGRRRHGWTLERAADGASFEYFYERMHLPTMRVRHGARARTETKDLAHECLFRRGGLFFVTTEGERVAGALCHWRERTRTLTMRLLGVQDGHRRHYDSGAFRALYHLLLEWACDNDVSAVDFGGTEAWIAKGIFQLKRRFGPRLLLAPNHYGYQRIWWHAAADTPGVRDFLVQNPVLEFANADQFRAVYFCDDQRAPQLDIAYRCANVQQHRIVHLDEFLAGLPTVSTSAPPPTPAGDPAVCHKASK